jgi:hypothetical protein
MARAYDMKRLHMGCGESLQSQLPQVVYEKLRRLALLQGLLPGVGDSALCDKKQIRDKSH